MSGRGPGVGRVLVVGLENEITNSVLGRRVNHRAQQRKAASLPVNRVLACREGDVTPLTCLALPYGEANQLEPFQRTLHKMEFRFGELPRRIAFLVRNDLHGHKTLLWF